MGRPNISLPNMEGFKRGIASMASTGNTFRNLAGQVGSMASAFKRM